MSINKEALVKKRVAEREVEIPDVGSVRVRALTRAEVLELGIAPGAVATMDVAEAEQKMLSKAMVDPEMTVDDIREWQASSPAMEINTVFEAVLELSGLKKGQAKELIKQFPDGPITGV